MYTVNNIIIGDKKYVDWCPVYIVADNYINHNKGVVSNVIVNDIIIRNKKYGYFVTDN